MGVLDCGQDKNSDGKSSLHVVASGTAGPSDVTYSRA